MTFEDITDLDFQTLKNCAVGESPIPVYHDFLGGAVVAFMKGSRLGCFDIKKYIYV